MAKKSIAERLERVAQRQQKIDQDAARLREIQRRAQTRSLSELSRLAGKAGIDHLSPAALYACFLHIAAEAADPDKVARWEAEGQRRLNAGENDNRAVAVARFSENPAADIKATLKQLGFRWNRFLEQWEGRVAYDEAAAFITGAGGTVSRVAAPEPQSDPSGKNDSD